MIKLLLLFTLVPLLELWLIIEIGKAIGTLPTIFLVFITGFAGYFLVKSQGLILLRKVGDDLEQGIMPAGKLLDGLCILLGGAFLLTPGLFTDTLGFALLIPGSRGLIKRLIVNRIKKMMEKGTFFVWRP